MPKESGHSQTKCLPEAKSRGAYFENAPIQGTVPIVKTCQKFIIFSCDTHSGIKGYLRSKNEGWVFQKR